MVKIVYLSLISLLFIFQITAQHKNLSLKTFEIKNTSIRALEVVNDSTVWFAGSHGKFGRIINSELQIDSLIYNKKLVNFRSIAFNGEYIFILSIENPAILYKINAFVNKKSKPEIVYHENHEKVFYDSMTFFNEQNGLAMGDPTESCISIILTNDGGNSWHKLNCKNIPKIFEGEAAFAASNTNIAVYKNNVWLVTGGKKARIFHSNDSGENWKVYDTPIIQGGKMTGIYCVDFYNENIGIIMGGNWENKSSTNATKALTSDGGKTWKLITNGSIPGYISCVQYVPDTKGKEIVAVSTEGIYFSNNNGNSWARLSAESYYSIRFINKKTAWLSGNNKIAKMNLH